MVGERTGVPVVVRAGAETAEVNSNWSQLDLDRRFD